MGNYDLIVVGSGISGATIAYIAAHDYHQRVLVLEKESHIAGLAYDERDHASGMLVQKTGSRFIHTDDEHIYKFLKGIVDLYPFQLTANTIIQGKEVPIPFHFGSIDVLYGKEDACSLKREIAEEYRYERFVPLLEMLRSENERISEFAKLILQEHFIPLEAARQGVPAEKLDGRVLRGHYFQLGYNSGCYTDRYQFLPCGGFTAMIEKMLSDPRITLKTGVNAANIFTITEGEKSKILFEGVPIGIPVVYTGSLDELFSNRYGVLPYHHVSEQFKIERERQLSAPCLNTPGDEKGFSMTDHSFFDEAYSCGKTVVSIEKSSKNGYSTTPKASKKSNLQYKRYRRLADRVEGLFLCGRLAEYRFLSISDAICGAMELIGRLPLSEIDLVPDYVKYKRPLSEIVNSGDNFKKNQHIASDLLIGDLSRQLPDVTIIIPTYKRLESLKRALASVWKQDISNDKFDVLVLDNDPTLKNETQVYLSGLNRDNLYYYKNRENLGAYGNMNRCMELARTDWVAMLHDDDVLFPNAIRWALNSKDAIHDPKLGLIIPRQLQAFSRDEVKRRMNEKGILQRDLIRERKKLCVNSKKRWEIYQKTFENTRRRFWRISKFDCYMIPFLYPAPSYGTLINRKAMLDIGGYGEGYPTDDNLCCIKMSEKYNCYLCGESWGVYSFYSADVMKPRSALQFVDAVVQYRIYMEQHNFLCKIVGKIIRQGAYLDAVEGDFWFGKNQRGYNTAMENYKYYTQYQASDKRKCWCRRIQKVWELWVMARTYLFGKRISYEMIQRCRGEHI